MIRRSSRIVIHIEIKHFKSKFNIFLDFVSNPDTNIFLNLGTNILNYRIVIGGTGLEQLTLNDSEPILICASELLTSVFFEM